MSKTDRSTRWRRSSARARGTHDAGRAAWIASALLLVVTSAIIVAAAEIVLRGTYARRYRSYPPSTVSRMTTPEYDVEIAINAQGFRDRDHAAQKPAGAVRVAVIGDSFTWGSGVEAGEIYTAQLESILREREGNASIEVFNFGVTWTGPVYYGRVLLGAAARYKPDVVVVAIYAGNDVADALRETRQPRPRVAILAALRELRDARGSAKRAPRGAGFGWAAQGEENPATLPALERVGASAGVSAETVAARYHAIPESIRAAALAYRVNPFNLAEAVTDPESIVENVLLEGAEMEEAWRATEEALAALERDIERHGARMVIVAIPAAPQVGRQYWWLERLGFRFDERLLTESPVQDRLARFAAARGIPYVDLLPGMRGSSAPPLYFEQDGHWTAAGHAIAARAIAEVVASQIGRSR
ncbi:MAG: GDSL-type esterase/lipase family protein [bacterium]